MYFEYSYITEILPKVEIWCSSHGNDKVHVESLLRLKQFFSIPAQCKPHTYLNTSRGIIRCPDLAGVSIDDIIDGLADQNVIQARRITITRDGIKCETNRIILTFQTAIVPKTLKVGYLKVPVDLYIPNPLQCYTCFKFGHHESRCNSGSDNICCHCAAPLSTHATPCADDCKKTLKCLSCGGEHMATSRSCPVWQREKEIVSVKYREGLSFQDARRVVTIRVVLPGSYAMAAKGKMVKALELKDAQTQTETVVPTETKTPPPKANSNKKSSNHSSVSSPVTSNVSKRTEKKLETKVQINLQMGSSQIAILRDLMTLYNNTTASIVLMRTWRRKIALQNLQVSKVV